MPPIQLGWGPGLRMRVFFRDGGALESALTDLRRSFPQAEIEVKLGY
jgi:hypothetical protein